MMYYLVIILGVIWALVGISTAIGAITDRKPSLLFATLFFGGTAVILFSYAEVLRG